MNNLKVLVADSTEEFCRTLAKALQGQYRIKTCQEGTKTLEILRTFVPDVLILDMMLPGLDGITLLQQAAQQGMHPMVLAMTNYFSEYIADAAGRFNVCYMMRKPCSAEACAARVADITRQLACSSIPREDPRTACTNLLLHLGIPAKLKGYGYLREGIILFARDVSQPVTKELYPAIGAQFDSTGEQVERAIRSAIQNAWRERDREAWQQYFPDSDKCPTNSEFIARLADVLLLESE